ncbi:MAG: hypothetical protein GY711_11435 [bacterium]|nr:hypothetical protein [bacterium]
MPETVYEQFADDFVAKLEQNQVPIPPGEPQTVVEDPRLRELLAADVEAACEEAKAQCEADLAAATQSQSAMRREIAALNERISAEQQLREQFEAELDDAREALAALEQEKVGLVGTVQKLEAALELEKEARTKAEKAAVAFESELKHLGIRIAAYLESERESK